MEQTEAFRILASADRQLVLHELVRNDGEASIDGISHHVAARRHRIAPEKVSEEKVERAYVRLIHTQLPALIGSDVIAVDWDDGIVSLVEGGDSDRLFEAAEELDSWPPIDLLEHPSRSS